MKKPVELSFQSHNSFSVEDVEKKLIEMKNHKNTPLKKTTLNDLTIVKIKM